jgi:hypothetical protein
MKHFLNWPGDFETPRFAATEFDRSLVALFDEIIVSGGGVHMDEDLALFGFSRNNRVIDFVRRGSRFWEVWPQENGEMKRLGPRFGLGEHACIVVRGIDDIRALAIRWLGGLAMEAVMGNITFWDRCKTRNPLERIT